MRHLPMIAVRSRAHLRPHAPATAVPVGPTQTLSYTEDTSTDFPNPERGWYEYMDGNTWGTHAPTNSYVRAHLADHGVHTVRLGMRYVRLDDYRNSSIPQWFLDNLWDEFATWRSTDMKAILRFAYNRSATDDAPYARVIEHLGQLKPLLTEYTDVIALLQSGFVGHWGEWHSSTNSLITNTSYRNGIIAGLFDATPSTMMVDQRYPEWVMHYWGSTTTLAYGDRFNGSNRARHGHKNDAWATSEHMTTYTGWDGPWSAYDERDFAAAQSTYTTMGGETDGNVLEGGVVNEWSDYTWIKGMKEMMHMDYLCSDWYQGILDKWGAGDLPDSPICLPEFSRRLGYRLVLNSVTLPTSVTAGASMNVSLTMSNVGFGKVYNPRPIDLLFVGSGGQVFPVRLTSDARRDLPLGGDALTVMPYTVTAPEDLQSGQSYSAFLRFPDPSAHLQARPGSCIRLANTSGWDATTGRHALSATIAAA